LAVSAQAQLSLEAPVKIISGNPSDDEKKVTITAKIVESETCSSDNSIVLWVTTRLKITNRGEKNIVLQKDGFLVIETQVSKSDEYAKEGKYLWESSSLIGTQFTAIENHSPYNSRFVHLKKGESYSFDRSEMIYVQEGNEVFLPLGSYVLQLSIRTWTGDTVLANELNEEWTKNGYVLWDKAIKTEPMPIKVDVASKPKL